MHNFKELKVWKAGIEISKIVFQLCKALPAEEKYGLISQMIRSAISIPSNIAEGCGRRSDKELYHFLSIALGSSFELETQLIIAKEFNYISQEKLDETSTIITEIQKMVYGLQKSLTT
ncbi:four helix bundle protein [Mucilaginibacter sp. HC2]|uniref:four helix bundle protein n=1 Tax=Mucilaginibacter inviolabilis TaxID=2714892 RepID=UPI00140AA1C5|nr:four helix bundle protein [Mucilaginibacter inviolabilis]NHA06683.1 four helix bundle protein [Mucilaginibacter inviolabilis]